MNGFIWTTVAVGFAVLIGIWLVGTFRVRTSRHVIAHQAVRSPVTLLHLSDPHGRVRYANGRLAGLVNRERPDLVVVTGDLATTQNQLPAVLKELGRIRCPLPLLFVPGNYEREEATGLLRKRTIDGEAVMARIEAGGLHVLANEGIELDLPGGTRLAVYGFDNSIYGLEQYPGEGPYGKAIMPPDERMLQSGSSRETEAYQLYLAHSPSIADGLRDRGLRYDLLLAGHTHGGQVRLFGRTWGAYRHFHTGAAFSSDGSVFGISRGLGTVRLPIRLNCPPELALYRLVPEGGAGESR